MLSDKTMLLSEGPLLLSRPGAFIYTHHHQREKSKNLNYA